MRAALMKQYLGLVLGIGLVVSGCQCGTPPIECGDYALVVDTPANGSTVSGMTDITVHATGPADQGAILLESPTLTDTANGSEVTAPVSGTVTGGQVLFSQVSMPGGSNEITVTATKKSSACVLTAHVTLNVPFSGPPKVVSCKFPQDLNNDNLLSAAELPTGTKLKVEVGLSNAGGGSVTLLDASNVAASVETPVVNNTASAEVTATNFSDTQYSFFAAVKRGTDTNNRTMNPEANCAITVQRQAPTCTLVTPSKILLGIPDDANTTVGHSLFRLHTLAQFGGNYTTAEIKLSTGATSLPQTTVSNTLAKDFDLPLSGTTYVVITAHAVDAAGNSCTDSKSISVDLDPPTIAIVEPIGNITTFNPTFTANVTGADGMTLTLTDVTSGSQIGQFSIVSGVATGILSLTPGLHTLRAVATDAAGNIGSDQQDVTATNPTACPLSFVDPVKHTLANNPTYLTQSDNTAPQLPGIRYNLTLNTSMPCAGHTVKLYLVQGANKTLINTDVANLSGEYVHTYTFNPSGTYSLDATIDDGSGNLTHAFLSVVATLESPAIISPVSNATLNSSIDLDMSTPGIQRDLSYSPNPLPVGATMTICSSVPLVTGAVACPDGDGYVYATNVPTHNPAFTFPDGKYSIKPVVILAGKYNSGPYVSLTVDSVRPSIVSATYGNDANADNCLNLAEQPTGAPVVTVTTNGVEDGQMVNITKGSSVIVSAAVTGNVVSIPLTALNATGSTESDYSLSIDVSDKAGNTAPTLASHLRVDRVGPTSTIASPNRTRLGVADDSDTLASGFQLPVLVQTATDVGTNGLVVSSGTGSPVSITPVSGNGNTTFTLPSSGTVAYVLTAAATDTCGNPGTQATFNVTVDNDVPTCVFSSPNAAGSPYGAFGINTTITLGHVPDDDVTVATVFSTPAAGTETQLKTLPVTSKVAQGLVSYFPGTQAVRATVVDPAGNSSSCSENIVVSATNCSIAVSAPATNPALLGRSSDSNPATPAALDYTLVGNSVNCPNRAVSFYSGTGLTRSLLGTTNTSGTGDYSFNLSMAEGATHIEIEMTDALNVVTQNTVDFTVDLTDPVLTAVSPSGSNLFFVAPVNSHFLAPADPAYIADTDVATSGAQYAFSATVNGANGGQLVVNYQGSPVTGFPVPITSASQVVNAQITLAHNSTGTLEIKATDAAGNSVSQSSVAVVDVIAPGAPVVTATLVLGKEREANVGLSWPETYDDGTTIGSGAHQGYDVRWATAITAPGGLANSNDFFDSSKAYNQLSESPFGTGVTTRTILVPPINSYFIYVRAHDEVGNYSDFIPATLAATTQVDNPGTKVTLANPATIPSATDLFGFVMAAGSVNNDAIDDLIVGEPALGQVQIYYGASSGFGTAAPQKVTAPDTTVSNFGFDVSVGKVSDSGSKDLVVGQYTANANSGSVWLFFGNSTGASLDTTAGNAIHFVGNASSSLGVSAEIIPDINGDGFNEILMSAPSENSLRGRVYLFFGRTTTAWKALTQPVAMTNADRIFEGPTPLSGGFTNDFGRRRGGFSAVGRTMSTGVDFTIPASRNNVNKVWVFDGSSIAADASGTIYTTGIAPGVSDQSFEVVSQLPEASGNRNGFGSRVIGNIDIAGSSLTDLVVAHGTQEKVFIYQDRAQTGFGTSTVTTIKGITALSHLFGSEAQAMDLNNDGKLDLCVGESFLTNSNLWFFFHQNTGPEFDTQAGTGFWQSKVTGSRLGLGMVTGDFNGDGKPDIAVSDDKDQTGKVFVWQ